MGGSTYGRGRITLFGAESRSCGRETHSNLPLQLKFHEITWSFSKYPNRRDHAATKTPLNHTREGYPDLELESF